MATGPGLATALRRASTGRRLDLAPVVRIPIRSPRRIWIWVWVWNVAFVAGRAGRVDRARPARLRTGGRRGRARPLSGAHRRADRTFRGGLGLAGDGDPDAASAQARTTHRGG